jgi:NAD(P)-dependent dehydrogenase (short-subunit alcohol dehydrogenase family)
LRRLGLPADVGKVVVFLACDDSAYINGTTVVLDGGAMAVW